MYHHDASSVSVIKIVPKEYTLQYIALHGLQRSMFKHDTETVYKKTFANKNC